MIAHATAPPIDVAVELAIDDSVTAEMRGVQQRIGDLYARLNQGGVLIHWEIGEQVLEVRNGPQLRYGRKGVEALAGLLKRDKGTLYRHARVAEQWARHEIAQLMEQRQPNGKTLLWAHFTALDRKDLTADERRWWVRRAITWGLSPRELTEHIDRSKGSTLARAIGAWLKCHFSVERLLDRQYAKAEALLDALPAGDRSLLPVLRLAQHSAVCTASAAGAIDRLIGRFLGSAALPTSDCEPPGVAPSSLAEEGRGEGEAVTPSDGDCGASATIVSALDGVSPLDGNRSLPFSSPLPAPGRNGEGSISIQTVTCM